MICKLASIYSLNSKQVSLWIFYKRTVKFLARSSYLVHMARGRRGRPASVRSRASRVSPDIEVPVVRPSRSRELLREGVSASVRTIEVARLLAALSPQRGRRKS